MTFWKEIRLRPPTAFGEIKSLIDGGREEKNGSWLNSANGSDFTES